MGIAERRDRDRAEREQRITAAARLVAEREGWGAVTIRRLAEEIEYSQPVLYSHFENKEAIVTAVAIQGFVELTAVLEQAAASGSSAPRTLEAAARAYLDFACANGAVYAAMFTLPTSLRFAHAETRAEPHDAFGTLAAAVAPFCSAVESATETVWATLHGLAELERSGRIRPAARDERVAMLVRVLTESGGA